MKTPSYNQFQAAKKNVKGRGGKVEGQPKKSSTAFMFFAAQERSKVKESNPAFTFSEIGKELGSRWGRMTPADKAPFEALANADRKRYDNEFAAFHNKLAHGGHSAAHAGDDDEDDEDEDDDEEDDEDDQ